MSITEVTKAVLSTRGKIVGNLIGKALPLIGLSIAVIVNAAWICLLGYFVLKLI